MVTAVAGRTDVIMHFMCLLIEELFLEVGSPDI